MKLQRQRSVLPPPPYREPSGRKYKQKPSSPAPTVQKQADLNLPHDPVPRVPLSSLHLIDPKTGRPPTSGRSSVIARVGTILRRILATVTTGRSSSSRRPGTASDSLASPTRTRMKPSWPQQKGSKPEAGGDSGHHVRGSYTSSRLADRED